MKDVIIKIVSWLLSMASIITSGVWIKTPARKITEFFTDLSKISYSDTFYMLQSDKQNSTEVWRQGMVSGNGLQGVITSGAPYDDTFIFQNMHFIMPNQNVRYCPNTVNELETVKQAIVKGENIVDTASYDDVYRYHPGGQLRVSMDGIMAINYLRYTDYETAQVGVYFENAKGAWQRTTFTSKADNAVITKLSKSSKGAKINTTLSIDDLSTMANFGQSNEANIQYKKLVSDKCDYIALIAHYPAYENSELKDGGYATLTYIVTDGKKEKTSLGNVKDSQDKSENNPAIKISNADNVYLITLSLRDDTMGKFDAFAAAKNYKVIDTLYADTKAVADKYGADKFDYNKALDAHLKIYQPEFNAVELKLDGADSTKSNEKLINGQKQKSKLNSDLIQRAYYNGRYAYISCAGTSTSRLYGMWTGEFNTGWGSKYTMDANVNLQTSSMNTSNIASAPIGYTYFILRQLPDWEENALNTHGYTNCIQAPVNTDGDGAVLTETCYPYPFRYWNAGTSWMIQPLFETLQCYGDMQIPLSDEFDLYKIRNILSATNDPLTDDEIKAIEEKGYLMLKEDVLLPLLIKSCNYWMQLMTPEYYTTADGKIHYEQGKTSLKDGEFYCILPSYSPENTPKNYPSPSTANCAIDISASKHNFEMLISVMKDVNPDADVSGYEQFMAKIPPYTYDETGALKEWCTTAFEENNEHRHLSHLYCVWPLFETQHNAQLKKACEQAIANRASENEASHALIHRSLIAARLKDRSSITEALLGLMSHRIYYNSLMTNHHYNRSSCYCTDFTIGYLGIINESLLYSNNGEIEILPALLESGCNKGSITGLKARTQATVNEIKWDVTKGTATAAITSDIDQTITVSCGLGDATQNIKFAKGETKTVTFNF